MSEPENQPNDLEAMQTAMNDPRLVQEVQSALRLYQPAMEALEGLVATDSRASDALRDIGCYICDLLDLLECEFDPGLSMMILQQIGSRMAAEPEKWNRYTTQVAPRVNARKLRDT